MLLLECWGQWKEIYKDNKKMKFRVDKVKKVLKANSHEYYNYLEKLNQNIVNMRKKDIKDKRDSVLKTQENKFEIRELPDNPGSNFSSVKKDSNIRDDLTSEIHPSARNLPLELKDFTDFAKHLSGLTEIMNNLRGYFGFEMSEAEIMDFALSGKPMLDESYHQFVQSFSRCLTFGEGGPKMADKAQADAYDWERMRGDGEEIRAQAQTFYETFQKITKKNPEITFKQGKSTLEAVNLAPMADFVLEKYKRGKETELFDSTVKETKNEGKDDFNFEIPEMGDAFEEAPSKDPKPTSFGLEQTADAFKGFDAKKSGVDLTEKKDGDFNFDFDNFGDKDKEADDAKFGDEADFENAFADNKRGAHEERNQMKYPLDPIMEEPQEVDSRLASKISYRGKADVNSEYNIKSTKGAQSQDRNLEIGDFESYNETVDNRSMMDSNAYYKDNQPGDVFGEKRWTDKAPGRQEDPVRNRQAQAARGQRAGGPLPGGRGFQFQKVEERSNGRGRGARGGLRGFGREATRSGRVRERPPR